MDFFSTEGRMNRSDYFWGIVPIVVLTSLISGASYSVNDDAAGILNGLAAISALSLIFPVSQRFHDIGLSAWYTILLLLPPIGLLTMLLLLFWPGMKSPNKFGEIPKGRGAAKAVLDGDSSSMRSDQDKIEDDATLVDDGIEIQLQPQSEQSDSTEKTLEEKLMELHSLYERGLLEESVYKQMQSKILKEL